MSWDEWTCSEAASHGHLELLQWARGEGCPWTFRTCSDAAKNGHVDVVRWSIEHGCLYNIHHLRRDIEDPEFLAWFQDGEYNKIREHRAEDIDADPRCGQVGHPVLRNERQEAEELEHHRLAPAVGPREDQAVCVVLAEAHVVSDDLHVRVKGEDRRHVANRLQLEARGPAAASEEEERSDNGGNIVRIPLPTISEDGREDADEAPAPSHSPPLAEVCHTDLSGTEGTEVEVLREVEKLGQDRAALAYFGNGAATYQVYEEYANILFDAL